jgi:hypothetical protein
MERLPDRILETTAVGDEPRVKIGSFIALGPFANAALCVLRISHRQTTGFP